MTARISNRMPRAGRANPGRHHLAGRDVTMRMQRQYEDILDSLRRAHRYGSDAKRKQVAAATVRKLAENPGHHHLAGADVTPKMQRQYEDILESLRHYHRYSSDEKRKQVAAATVRKLAENPLANPGGEEAEAI